MTESRKKNQKATNQHPASKKLNKYNGKYENIREFLRRISYGCYHRGLFEKFGISPRSYDDYLYRMRFFLPESHLEKNIREKRSCFHFRSDAYYASDNFLINSFYIKTLTADYCFFTILTLQLLASNPNGLTLNDLLSNYAQYTSLENPDDPSLYIDRFSSTLRRTLNELSDLGFVRKKPWKKQHLFSLTKNPLSDLSNTEIQTLLLAAAFYQNTALLAVPGACLAHTLSRLSRLNNSPSKFYQFKNNSFTRVLDEEVLLSLLDAIQANHPLTITYQNKSSKAIHPQQIESDYVYNRQYLLAFENNVLERFRIDRIKNPVPQTIRTNSTPPKNHVQPKKEKLHPLVLQLHFSTQEEKGQLIRTIEMRYPELELLDTTQPESCILQLNLTDPLQAFPWLRTLHPHIEIIGESNAVLRSRMRKDLEEALQNYGHLV